MHRTIISDTSCFILLTNIGELDLLNYNLLHTITGFGIILSLMAKVITHYYIDYVHERGLNLSSLFIMPLYYFRPYTSKVNPEYEKLKYLCNSFLVLAGLSLVLNIVFGVLLIP